MTRRNFCFTLNISNDEQLCELDFSLCPAVRYAIWQLEMAGTGQLHYQGYLECSSPQRYSAFRVCGLEGAHFETRRGSRDSARDYCRKEDSRVDGPYEYGTWTGGQGTRTDLAAVEALVRAGAGLAEVATQAFGTFVRYHRGIERALALINPPRPRDFKSVVHFFYGPAGCGKSRAARELSEQLTTSVTTEHPSYANKPPCWRPVGSWFDGYDGQAVLVLDDFAGNTMAYSVWKNLCDRYPLRVPVKGSFIEFVARHIIITSTRLPQEWWTSDFARVDPAEISRRIEFVYAWNGQEFVTFETTDNITALEQAQQ